MKNKVIIISILAISSTFIGCQGEYSLSSQSKNSIVAATLKGVGITSCSYLFCSYLWNDFKFRPSPIASIVWASVGGLIGGGWAYAHTPEAHYEYAKKGVLSTKTSNLMQLIIITDVLLIVSSLKEHFFKEKLPLFTAFTELTVVFNRLQDYEESLQVVLDSHRTDLHQDAQELLKDIAHLKNVLKKAMMPLKEDAHFIAEYNAQTMHQMQEAQMIAAHAAESSAWAQWVKPTVIVTTK